MKVYSNNTKEKKKLNKKNLYAIILSGLILICAVAITLAVTLTSQSPVDEGGGPIAQVDTKPTFVSPLAELTVSHEFSSSLVYNPTYKHWRTHNGVDLSADAGSSVMAISDGTVKTVVDTTLEGLVVTIEHADGIVSVYKSLSSEAMVEEGDIVKAGDVIGKLENRMMGEQWNGVHLHLEVTKAGEYVNPLDYLPISGDK